MHNRVVLTACIAEAEPLRCTPAGLPAIALRIAHTSQQTEVGQPREVKAAMKAVAFGAMAERLARQDIGSLWTFSGFLASPRNGKNAVLHVQDIQQT
ncbi:primosomal replication protein N [Verminephrobacter aporrectodeae]|uniref:Replication restart protein PriB n=1 Tax=Verminephrobacter aporrectodeae subsp. tuberculatae TaxID=1110392 RepID=A0ABT3KXS3_9BURK|nr:primosomal replication protein N [Verminephrobacter aporrectodeae]MCW5221025.1 primosomal replication protein N [Verminephrobacter aporrectodeae subsp. tuberculatae]MCW5258699.1 primosomal replication protein N [Verminephrobacter aporrectodeae subsp. tuberculatae]MCW5290318.1 primosomal replication protein N [Verminephrobacter aporrectodeae subsp. tuberculatae]MCW5323127.1 primosomal replication protein N [Verminephrobacter aporrectodeae subsp. tuberculatae]MCW8165230.1 primosomal replicati